MKSACRNVMRGVLMPRGRFFAVSASAASMRCVRRTVSAVGCFCTDRITAGAPSSPASPRRIAGAKRTSAT